MSAGCRAPTVGPVLARVRSLSPRLADWLLTAVLTAYAQVDVWLRHGVVPGPNAVGAVGLAAMTLPLGLRRRWPLAVACVSMAALAAESLAAGGAPGGGAGVLAVLGGVCAGPRGAVGGGRVRAAATGPDRARCGVRRGRRAERPGPQARGLGRSRRRRWVLLQPDRRCGLAGGPLRAPATPARGHAREPRAAAGA